MRLSLGCDLEELQKKPGIIPFVCETSCSPCLALSVLLLASMALVPRAAFAEDAMHSTS